MAIKIHFSLSIIIWSLINNYYNNKNIYTKEKKKYIYIRLYFKRLSTVQTELQKNEIHAMHYPCS